MDKRWIFANVGPTFRLLFLFINYRYWEKQTWFFVKRITLLFSYTHRDQTSLLLKWPCSKFCVARELYCGTIYLKEIEHSLMFVRPPSHFRLVDTVIIFKPLDTLPLTCEVLTCASFDYGFFNCSIFNCLFSTWKFFIYM